MGNFYVNHAVRTTDHDRVKDLLAGRDAYISPVINGIAAVYDKEADSQDEDITAGLAKLLSAKMDTVVMAILNHDDDILMYWLSDRGTQTDAYNSTPNYFSDTLDTSVPSGGNSQVLCRSFGSPNFEAAERILRSDDYVFALDRHLDLLNALGVTPEILYLGYRHLEAGDFPDNLGSFIKVG